MKIKGMTGRSALLLTALVGGILLSVGGCTPKPPDVVIDQKRVDTAKAERDIFDKVGGDWSKLTEPDKQQYIKLTGLDPEKAKNWWVVMKYGLNGAPPGKGAEGPK